MEGGDMKAIIPDLYVHSTTFEAGYGLLIIPSPTYKHSVLYDLPPIYVLLE